MNQPFELYNLIKETFLLLDFGDRSLLERYDLSVTRYYALYHIGRSPGVLPSKLSDYMFCDKSNITRILRNLEADDYIIRRPHENDGRAQRLYLSPTGEALYKEVSAEHEAYVAQRLQQLDGSDRSRVSGILSSLNKDLGKSLNGHVSGD